MRADAASTVLAARGLTVAAPGGRPVVDGADLDLQAGEIVGLTGPSGAGKSTLAFALLGLARAPFSLAGGQVLIGGRDLLSLPEEAARAVRGRDIGLIVQNPRAALHPMLDVGRQIGRIWRTHTGGDARAARDRALEMLRLVGINDPDRRAAAFAHELSGGMAQRVLIAAALAADPAILVADEPTSGLDVTVQAQFLDLMWRAAKDRGTAMLLVTQEPGVLANYCDRVLTMEAGRIVADRPTRDHFAGRAVTARAAIRILPATGGAPVATAEALTKRFPLRDGKAVHAVDDLTLSIRPGEAVGLVGESGSGKTTAGRCLLRLIEPTAGRVTLAGRDLSTLSAGHLRRLRAKAQIVRQDPFDSFDPRWTLGRSLREPLDAHRPDMDAGAKAARVAELIRLVGCDPRVAGARPRDLSAGMLQRLAIARALATEPAFIVLDEPTSVLTPDARREIVALLRRLQDELGVAYLFISHDLTTVAALCHRVVVMYLGQIVEEGTTAAIFDDPRHPYTRALIAAHLDEDPANRRVDRPQPDRVEGEIPSPIDLPTGCYLASRCPMALDRCGTDRQVLTPLGHGRAVRCWRVGEQDTDHEVRHAR